LDAGIFEEATMSAEERDLNTAEEMESDIEEHEEGRDESEVNLQKEVNQDIQTGTNDATHTGINWGSSYKTTGKRKRNRSKKASGSSATKR
jgi:ribosomal protein S13